MACRRIVAHQFRGLRSRAVAEVACTLAHQHGSEVRGVFALSAEPMPVHYPGGEIGVAMNRNEGAYFRESVTAAEEDFRAATMTLPEDRVHWGVESADASDALVLRARTADLVVTGQTQPGDPAESGRSTGFCDELALSAGCPVLFVPYAGRFERIGARVFVAWNGSRESARALRDALPWLVRADEVVVVSFGAPPPRAVGVEPAVEYLAVHGVRASAVAHANRDIDIGAQLLSRAADAGSDLIVMGAWGHSRLREFVLGGVTRTILESMTAPVLMSH